jgi:hypothetical protein
MNIMDVNHETEDNKVIQSPTGETVKTMTIGEESPEDDCIRLIKEKNP